MYIRYIYDYDYSIRPTLDGPTIHCNKRPVGCIVINGDNIGVSFANENKEKSLNKKFGRDIAIARSIGKSDYLEDVPNKKITNLNGQTVTAMDEVEFFIERHSTPKKSLLNILVGEKV